MQTRILRQQEPLRLFVMFLMHHVEALGVSAASIRDRLGLAEGWLEALGEDELVELVPRLVGTCASLTGDELLCLHAGERFHFCLAGVGGLVATHAPTPALALETFGQFVASPALLRIRSLTADDETTLTAEVTTAWPESTREQVLDGYFSSLVAALRAVCGSAFAPQAIRLARPESDDRRALGRVLRGRLSFEAERDEMVFATADLTGPSLLFEPLLFEQLKFIADLGAARPSGTSPMRQLVEQAIRAGAYTIESAAEMLQIKTRTLQRRLQREGTSFRSVLSEIRVELASDLLRQTDLPLTEIADRLQYSDDKGLRKAIRHVTGKAPSEIRGAATVGEEGLAEPRASAGRRGTNTGWGTRPLGTGEARQ